MELRRPRGFATFVTFPLKDGNGNLVSGVNTLRPQYATFTDANPVSTISNIAGFCAELGATGIYYSSLSASEMANDYIYFIASPTATAKRLDILINCTKIASVQAVSDIVTATLSSGTGTGQANLSNGRIGINWADIANATTTQALTLTTIATASAVGFVASVSVAVLSNVGTVTGVTNSVTANVGTVTGVTNSVTANVATVTGVVNSVSVTTVTGVVNSVGVREGTGGNVFSLTNGRVGLDWTNIVNATSTQAFPLTTIGTVSAVAFVASVGSVVLSSVGTVTGVTNSVNANVATITGVTNSVNANVATVTGVVNSVNANVATITGVTNSVNANVATVTGVVNSVSANVGTISGVLNRVDATLTQGVQSMIADRLLFRNLAGGVDGGRTVQDAFRLLRNRRNLTTGAMQTATLTAFIEDDTTPAWTAIVGTSTAVGLTDVDAS